MAADVSDPPHALPRDDNNDLKRGETISRFVVLATLGAGGMGVVYSAYDADLDRKVAIKLLASTANNADASLRLLREAQAMAKINHPNVIKVHEVGKFGDQIYLAMEFADAGTLRVWLRDKRDLHETLDAFIAAGTGLAAAHAAGLVHRDFKPDNVLRSKSGAVQVMDFGLVSSSSAPQRAHEPAPDDSPLSNTTPLSQELTRTGSIMGTPTYMAPEQFTGAITTARTDQFSFCVALYEALYGSRPFAGESYVELSVNVLAGAVLSPPPGSNIPPWLRRVLLRGLETEPEKRFESAASARCHRWRRRCRCSGGRILDARTRPRELR
jgi:eukaryotic-like serine/threonine-protein kinase